MIAPLMTIVRCDTHNGKEGDRCKRSFQIALPSLSLLPGEVVKEARRAHPDWLIGAEGDAMCPDCLALAVVKIAAQLGTQHLEAVAAA